MTDHPIVTGPAVEHAELEPKRSRRSPSPGQRDHGELSEHQAGPSAERHAEDVTALLTAARDEAKTRLGRAQQQRHRAEQEAEQWQANVDHYDAMLRALASAPNTNGRRR